MLVAACFYSLLTVRIGRYARQAAPVRLASSKSTALAAIALASLAVLAVKRGLGGEGVASLWGNPFDLVALGAITWAALGPGAGAAFLQSKVSLPHFRTRFVHGLHPEGCCVCACVGAREREGAPP